MIRVSPGDNTHQIIALYVYSISILSLYTGKWLCEYITQNRATVQKTTVGPRMPEIFGCLTDVHMFHATIHELYKIT